MIVIDCPEVIIFSGRGGSVSLDLHIKYFLSFVLVKESARSSCTEIQKVKSKETGCAAISR